MDGRSTYAKIKKMLDTINQETISLTELRSLVMINIGASERTIKQSLKIMSETGLLQDVDNGRFKIMRDVQQ